MERRKRGRRGLLFSLLTLDSWVMTGPWGYGASICQMKQEAPPGPRCLFLSIFHLSPFFFQLWHKKSYKQNLHFICMAAHCFLPPFFSPHLLPPIFFLHIQHGPRARAGICGLVTNRWDFFFFFMKKKKREIPICQQLSLARPHMLTRAHASWIKSERDFDPRCPRLAATNSYSAGSERCSKKCHGKEEKRNISI